MCTCLDQHHMTFFTCSGFSPSSSLTRAPWCSFSSGLGGSKYISFEQRQWHNECFNCKRCSVSLVGRGFLTSNDDILCPDCGTQN